jgi:hypothetical protein
VQRLRVIVAFVDPVLTALVLFFFLLFFSVLFVLFAPGHSRNLAIVLGVCYINIAGRESISRKAHHIAGSPTQCSGVGMSLPAWRDRVKWWLLRLLSVVRSLIWYKLLPPLEWHLADGFGLAVLPMSWWLSFFQVDETTEHKLQRLTEG